MNSRSVIKLRTVIGLENLKLDSRITTQRYLKQTAAPRRENKIAEKYGCLLNTTHILTSQLHK